MIVAPPPLPVGNVTLNVVPLPFVNVIVVPLTLAVVNAKLADVNRDEVAEFNEFILTCCDADEAFKLEIDTNADALNVSKFCVSINKLAVVVFKLLIDTC